jgi:superfamily II DNA or RNA helicase
MINKLLPVKGAWVRTGFEHNAKIGLVADVNNEGNEPRILVRWNGTKAMTWILLSEVRCGFKRGMDVMDIPLSRVRKSLGEGVTVDVRQIGDRDQVLVEFLESGTRRWLPYENLKQIKGVRHRFLMGNTGGPGSGERFRLRNLAHALELWNENTGALSHLDIDPLPHQVHLVHHILASGNLNWLIADDVGLGKTIEVGMLLSALKQRKKLRRVLLITPAGLTKQWQDELRYKFGFENFQIYGEDFFINEPHQWKIHDHVIGSIDRFKDDGNLQKLLQAEPWDLVVFDEAHRLSRRQYGKKLESSRRFKLAVALRLCTDSIILLSATPHQGMQDKFQALLEVLRPEWKKEIRALGLNPEILKHMVVRNNKADVTDSEGHFIFKGKTTKAISVDAGEEARQFDRALQKYLRLGYSAGQTLGLKGNAIGFVMTIYRKLAASSAAAIHSALLGRMERLLKGDTETSFSQTWENAEYDRRFEGEREESLQLFPEEFFNGEILLLQELIEKAGVLLKNDFKLKGFLDDLIPSVLEGNPEEKILIFTEYRKTQAHLALALSEKYGAGCVELIHGSMTHHERRAAIVLFEDQAQFLISTEAGGEGINLQSKCHIMVNYDLPWNPMRLVQRIGRLYRYGQKNNVVVFNLHSPQTLDEQIMGLMYNRIDQVVKDLAVIGDEFKAGLEDDILGEFADLLDVQGILKDATVEGISRTKDRIEDALKRASESTQKQRELFEYASSFDPNEVKNDIKISPEHVAVFVAGMFKELEVEILANVHNGAILDIRLPEKIVEEEPGLRSRMQVTFDRVWAANRPNLHMMDLNSRLMQYLLTKAKAYDFGGLAAVFEGLNGEALITGILRWQNDHGQRMRQEYTALLAKSDGNIETNPSEFEEWLKSPKIDGQLSTDRVRCQALYDLFEKAANERLAAVSNRDLHPENLQWTSAGWVGNTRGARNI